MFSKQILLAVVTFFLPTPFSITRAAEADAPRPNFILFIADDMAWDDCGAYGNPHVHTPNIDRLARNGMKFELAMLTISSCSPSRASLITGRYPHNTDAEELHWPLPGDQTTFVESLKSAGYWTAAAGKWHLGDEVRDRFDLVREADSSGFQLPTGEAGQTGKFVEKAQGDTKSGCTEWVDVLQARPRNKPFFLWLAALDPHRPYDEAINGGLHDAEDVRVAPYHPDTPAVRRDYAAYYDEIQRLDRFVGDVLSELERQASAENTIVLFLSDNGRPFPRDKTTLYDSGVRTPLIVRWPAKVAAGSVCRSLVSSVDIAPTIVSLAGVAASPTFQGKSFAKLLSAPTETVREYAFAEKNWHDFEDHARAVRSTRFKYIRNDYNDLPNTPPADAVRSPTFLEMVRLRAAGGLSPSQSTCFVTPRPTEELYDTLRDPHELENLAANPHFADTLAELREALRSWERETNDRVPALRTADEFDRVTGKPTPARRRPRWSKKRMVEAGLAAP